MFPIYLQNWIEYMESNNAKFTCGSGRIVAEASNIQMRENAGG